jgi:hypothetical protein
MRLISKLAAAAAVTGLALGFGGVSAKADSYMPCGRPGVMPCGPFPGPGPHPYPPAFDGHHRHHHSGIGIQFSFGNADPYHGYYRPHYIYRPVPIIRKVRFCSNDSAIYKARALGVRHIRAVSYHDYILINGRKHGHPVQIAFARARGCPIIDY